jgi:hypothetical protein
MSSIKEPDIAKVQAARVCSIAAALRLRVSMIRCRIRPEDLLRQD